MKEELVSVGELRDKLYALYPEDEVINVMKGMNDFKDKDLILRILIQHILKCRDTHITGIIFPKIFEAIALFL
jgi:hypothetical protein